MKVLIDGHNALGALDVRGRTHEERRHALLAWVGRLATDATVYFDARRAPEGLFEREAMHGVLAVYCRDHHADEFILDAVRAAANPANILVVSNDREVTGKAKQQGAKAMRIQDWFGEPERPEVEKPRPNLKIDFKPSDFGLPDEVDLSDPDLD
ncbi:MAG: NYN domain-containing protein [Planctomycetota bacterium]|jgi:predicted RNA-binding protein with PIN domain